LDHSQRELVEQLWTVISDQEHSPSHDRWHLDRVLHFALELAEIHGGDIDILAAAVMLHDLGRGDPSLHGEASRTESERMAAGILQEIGFPLEKRREVLLAIHEHDDPSIIPSTIEGRILKEADFLAGLGAWGLLRIAMWAAETGGGFAQVFDRLEHRMPARVSSMAFRESRRHARQEMDFVNLFLNRLRSFPALAEVQYAGRYIVLDGMSGLGKDTQAEILVDRLCIAGYEVTKVSEPSDQFKERSEPWGQDASNEVRLFLHAADRHDQISRVVLPALKRGEVVVSIRSYLSTIAYQQSEGFSGDLIRLIHGFVPTPDLVLILDAPPEVAYQRILGRAAEGSKPISELESPESLSRFRSRYLEIASKQVGNPCEIVDADRDRESVAESVWTLVQGIL
jgi:dTMP kinase